MEVKKNNKINLENKKSIFFQLGLVISLLLVLTAFEWKKYDSRIEDNIKFNPFDGTEEMPPISFPDPPKVIPPPSIPTNIEEVENDAITNEDLFLDSESDIHIYSTYIYTPPIDDPEPEIKEDFILHGTEIMPSFPGGEEALLHYLKKNTVYPTIAREIGITGTVHVSFVVEKDGSISNITVVKSVESSLDTEAIRVVANMPRWNPGTQRSKPVRVWQTLPVKFTLI